MAEQQVEQGQENQVHQPQDQVVTATNDLGVLPLNFFGCDSTEYPENEIQSFPLRTTKERMVHAFLPLVKKILILFKLKKTSVFIHEGKMRQKTEQHSLCGKGTYKVGRVPLWARVKLCIWTVLVLWTSAEE
ncbi:hypothetical protein STEG23_034782 [Scotinomys teguina]